MTTSTMTKDQALMFRAAENAAVKRYSKMTKVQLRNEWLAALSDTGSQSVYGGPVSKDELIRAILELRGYTVAKLNEAIHASAHDVTWPDCEFCRG